MPRDELVARLRAVTERLLHELESVSESDWSSLVVSDPYLGPLPVMIIAAGMLGGLTVHAWDIRQGLGVPHAIVGDAADLLVPFVFLLWWATADTAAVEVPYSIGIRTTGHNRGDTRFEVSDTGLQFGPGDISECAGILELDPASLVLTAYNRINAGTVRGDQRAATDFRSLFTAI